MKIAKGSVAEVKDELKKQAVVGVVGVKRIIVSAIAAVGNFNTKFFTTIDDAKDWLVAD